MSPSPLSFVLSSLFAGLVLLGASWHYLQTLSFFETYLSGHYGFSSLLSELNTALSGLFSSNLSYNIAVICFAILFGLGVYALVASWRHMLYSAHTTFDEVGFADQRSKRLIQKSLELRIGLRAVSAFVWLGYAFFFFNDIIPYCASFITEVSQPEAALASVRNLLAFLLLVLSVHIHVIFIRLIVLRPRLFSDGFGIGRGGHDQ